MPGPKSAPAVRRRLFGKAASKAKRASALQGVRTGFAAPAPSRVPVGALETKVQRQPRRDLTPSNAGSVISLNGGINQGTAVYNRIGHKFKNTACRVKGHFLADNNGPRAAICGYAWVWDKSPNGALPAVDSIFTIDAANGFDMANTMLVDDNSDRFTVLKSVRKQIGRSNNDATGWKNEGLQVVLFDDLLKLPAYCTTAYAKGTATGTVAALQTGGLYLVPFVSNITGETANTVKMLFTTELFFAEA